jgi:hypothetical protein
MGLPPGEEVVLSVQPPPKGHLAIGIVGHLSEVAELAADFLGPTARLVPKEGKIGVGLL